MALYSSMVSRGTPSVHVKPALTLVQVSLPCSRTGGEQQVRLGTRKAVLPLQKSSRQGADAPHASISWAAFYSDCKAEERPVAMHDEPDNTCDCNRMVSSFTKTQDDLMGIPSLPWSCQQLDGKSRWPKAPGHCCMCAYCLHDSR